MVKWDASTDQILLLKILETSQVNADVKAIAEAWPSNLDKPTPRAITERLVKIRKDVKSNGVNTNFSVKSTKGTSNPSNGKPLALGTPQKRAPRGSLKATSTAKNSNGKRNWTDGNQDDDSAEESNRSIAAVPSTPTPQSKHKRAKTAETDHVSLLDEDNQVVKVEDDDFGNGDANDFGGDGAGDYRHVDGGRREVKHFATAVKVESRDFTAYGNGDGEIYA